VGISETHKVPLPKMGVCRVTLFAETYENLSKWATDTNWKQATEIHKKAYFTRTENLVQEEVLQKIRQHYVECKHYVSSAPVQAALFRIDCTRDEFRKRCDESRVMRIPGIKFGVFDESSERCIVDFANKRLGGGWLGYGMVQEEKMFIERFDYGALCARSLLEMPDPVANPHASPFSMHPDEAWILRGAPRFADVGWYGRTPADALSKLTLLNPVDDSKTAPAVVAIDAIKASFPVYEREHLEMMLIKAYTGFAAASNDPDVGGYKQIATGSWGCGAFYNNERVMFVVQALAANVAGVSLVHHVLGDGFRIAPALAFLEDCLVHKLTVGQALDALVERCASDEDWKSKWKPPQVQEQRRR